MLRLYVAWGFRVSRAAQAMPKINGLCSVRAWAERWDFRCSTQGEDNDRACPQDAGGPGGCASTLPLAFSFNFGQVARFS